MEKTISVFHQGALARYNIIGEKNGCFVARLLSYKGGKENKPPHEFSLHKEGKKWRDDGAEQNLVDDVGYGIDFKIEDMYDNPVRIVQKDERKNNRDNEM